MKAAVQEGLAELLPSFVDAARAVAREAANVIAETRTGTVEGDRGSSSESHASHFSSAPKTTRSHLTKSPSAFRAYLRSKKVLAPQDEPPPPSVAAEVVRAFEEDNIGGPDLSHMLLDWGHSFKRSLWNKEAVALLCFDFQDKLKGGIYNTVVYDPNIMTLDFIRHVLLDKLERPQASFRRNERADENPGQKTQTFTRCNRIIEENRHRDPQLWDSVEDVLTALGSGGMSGDETDTTPDTRPKRLRRVALPWINSDISELFNAVESYEAANRTERLTVPVGNQSFPREFYALRNDQLQKAVPGLPRNWYDDNWIRGLSHGIQQMLCVQSPKSIPSLPQYTPVPGAQLT
ncbi:hypothetical protein BV22DRAFT_1135521 [Leucogyrophana mollusca]|uniref:Uncharacterized protein n=1 Tax=Leucogyrophana mollusca TaxID=85980 RepID=A0ACB8AVK7_9AGAM|nr:hypothetical protein BV22DRAFT_1135521 [Leucogyrophana mollusca]